MELPNEDTAELIPRFSRECFRKLSEIGKTHVAMKTACSRYEPDAGRFSRRRLYARTVTSLGWKVAIQISSIGTIRFSRVARIAAKAIRVA